VRTGVYKTWAGQHNAYQSKFRTGAIGVDGTVFWHGENRPPLRFVTISEKEAIRQKEAGEWW
jgi:hypothetical protein